MSTTPANKSPSAAPPRLSAAQERLLEAAVEVFAECGFAGTTTRDIAAKANRSPAAVYIHYATKEDLLFEITILGHRQALACLSAASELEEDPVQSVRGMVYAFSQWHMQNAKLGRVAQYEFNALSEQHRAEIAVLRRDVQHVMRLAIERGVTLGEFQVADVGGAADVLLSISIDLVRWFDPERQPDQHAIASQHAEFAVRMLRRHTVPPHGNA